MRKVILNLAVSLDGFIEGPHGEIDWCIFDDEVADELNRFISNVDTILYGRKSYELFGNYVPGSDGDESEKAFYEKVGQMKKYVFSTTLQEAKANDSLVRDQIAAQVQQIKQGDGKDIWLFGGAGLITSFINLNLIDEYQIGLHPVVLGGGLPLFRDIRERINLNLVQSKAFRSGMTLLYYHPKDTEVSAA
ncbi:dihydrofolate reductase family protein [Negadavirga shengliensis]|uniref:Dihydrofolate reductase family protein n=1 Tax=Negadavirga shengliensis TaxID=1389218 RepID=A0ABV9T7Z5_9BACT